MFSVRAGRTANVIPVAEHALDRLNVAAPPARCQSVALDFERYSEWALDVKTAEVLQRDGEGRPALVAFRAAAMGRSAAYTLRYSYPDENVITWVLVEGDVVSRLDGSYRFAAAADNTTEVTYELTVELTVPVPGFVKRRAEGKIVTTALRELKHRAEALEGRHT